MTRITSLTWTDDDIARLADLSHGGATVVRAAAALTPENGSGETGSSAARSALVGMRQAKAAARRVCLPPLE
jgi:hypothetical protein